MGVGGRSKLESQQESRRREMNLTATTTGRMQYHEPTPCSTRKIMANSQIFEVYDCGEHLVRHCDRFVQSRHANHGERLHAAAYTNSKMLAGRLLHYFSPDEGNSTEDAWCGWHNDT